MAQQESQFTVVSVQQMLDLNAKIYAVVCQESKEQKDTEEIVLLMFKRFSLIVLQWHSLSLHARHIPTGTIIAISSICHNNHH